MEIPEAVSAAPTDQLPPDPPLFRNRNFVLFFSGQLVSNTGNWLQLAAQSILVKELSGSSFMVGVTTAALFLPVLFLALPGGKLADRFDRRKLLIVTQLLALVATAALAALAALDVVTVAAVVVVALIVGIQYALSIPTMLALLPSLVTRGQLGMAIGMNSITYNVARVLGPSLATALVAGIGFGMAFALNSLSFVALIVALLLMRPRVEDAAAAPRDDGSIREALSYAWNDRTVRLLMIGVVTVSVAMDPVITLGPAFAQDVFGVSTAAAGYLVTAFGLGAIVAAFTVTRGFRTHGGARFDLLPRWSLIYAAGMIVFAFAPGMWVAIPALVVTGAGFLVTSTTWTTGIQEVVPPHLRGRVMGVWTLCFLGSRPFASMLDGAIGDLSSPRFAALLMVIPLVVVALVGAPRVIRATRSSG